MFDLYIFDNVWGNFVFQTTAEKKYLVRALEFSPDSGKLALAQSDNIVYIFKLGNVFGDKKSICNKFPQVF